MDKAVKRYIVFGIMVAALVGGALGACSGCAYLKGVGDFLGFTQEDQCTVCEDVMPEARSLICERMDNPCAVLDTIKLAAGEGVVWEAYTVDEAIDWLEQDVKPKLSVEWTYDRLRLFMLKEVSSFNNSVGASFFLLTRSIQNFSGDKPLAPKDLKLMQMALDSLLEDLNELKVILSGVSGDPRTPLPTPSITVGKG